MQTLIERGCGLDVHQATVVACLLIALQNRKVQKQVRTFDTTTRELLKLREWLLAEGCTHVAMESTGVYWISAILLACQSNFRSLGFECGHQFFDFPTIQQELLILRDFHPRFLLSFLFGK